jgi:PAS domain S-box-containing protein
MCLNKTELKLLANTPGNIWGYYTLSNKFCFVSNDLKKLLNIDNYENLLQQDIAKKIKDIDKNKYIAKLKKDGEEGFIAEIASNVIAVDGDEICLENIRAIDDSINVFKDAMESLQEAAFISDLNGKIIWFNKAFTELSGYTEEEILEKDCKFFLGGNVFSESYYSNACELMQNGEIWKSEYQNYKKDGTKYFEYQVVIPIKKDKAPVYFLVTKTDITSRVNYEEEKNNLLLKLQIAKGLAEKSLLEKNETFARLEKNEKKLTKLFEAMQDLILLINTEGIILEYQTPGITLKVKDLIGKNYKDVLPANMIENIFIALKELLMGKESVTFEFTLSDGNLKEWYLARANLIKDFDEGKDTCLFVISNITERKKAEEEIKRISFEYEKVFNGTQSALFLIEVVDGYEFKFIRNNLAHQKLTGLSLEFLKDKSPHDILDEETANKVSNNYKNCLLAGKSITYEETLDLPGGEKTWITTLTPIYESGIAKFIVGSAIDITEKKKIEKNLIESERRLRQIIDLVPHFIFAKDITGNYLMVNKALAEALGTTSQNMISKKEKDFYSDYKQVLKNLEDDADVIINNIYKHNPEEIFIRADGVKRYLQTTKIPFKYSEDSRPALLGVSVDITDLKLTELSLIENQKKLQKALSELEWANEQLKIAKEAAEIANRTKSEFLANMSITLHLV